MGDLGVETMSILLLVLSVNGFNELLTYKTEITDMSNNNHKAVTNDTINVKALENRMLCKLKLAPYIIIGTHQIVLITMTLLISHLILHYNHIRYNRDFGWRYMGALCTILASSCDSIII